MEYDDNFRNFCKAILSYSYVQEAIAVDEAMLLWLYNHSSGNASVVISLLHDSQEIAILEGHEQLDISVLNIAYEKRLTMLHNFINPLFLESVIQIEK